MLQCFYIFTVELLGLLKWRSMQGKLKDILVTVMRVSGEEIVKVGGKCFVMDWKNHEMTRLFVAGDF